MAVLFTLIKKETLHILRDRRTALITLVMPLVLLLLFGFAISTEINNIRVLAVVSNHTDETRLIIQRLGANEYFSHLGTVDINEAETALKNNKADAVLVLQSDPGDGSLKKQIIVDASNPNMGKTASAYIQSVVNGNRDSLILSRTLYNPMMKSAYNFVPGIMGMIFILVCAIMTSVSIVSEKESGTMNLLLVSPVNPRTVIIGKLIPYFALSCIILAVMLTISYGVLGLPLSSTLVEVVVLSLIYIVLSLSIGLLVSTLVETQLLALIVSAMVFMIPVIFLSGMIFPIDNMPWILQKVSCIVPARWYIAALRKVMIQELDFSYIIKELAILAGITCLILTLAIKKFKVK